MPEDSEEALESAYSPLNAKIVVFGHTHRPYIRQLKAFTVANSGSVSLAYDGDSRAKYLWVENGNVTIRSVEYNIEKADEDLMNSGLPYAEWLVRVLRAGRYVPPD